jgi:hypothetical protein
MSWTRSRSLDEPGEFLAFDHGRIDCVVIAAADDRPDDPRAGIEMVDDDGDEFDVGPDDVVDVAPGHDAWVVGDEPVIQVEWSGVRGCLEPLESLNERVLVTVVVTDIVDSTGHATRLRGKQVERSPCATQLSDA